MSEHISEQITLRDIQKESLEIQKLFSRVRELADLTSLRLETRGITVPSKSLQEIITPYLQAICNNFEVQKNRKLIATVERHIHDFFTRLSTLDTTKLNAYMTQRGIFENALYDRKWKNYTEDQKKGLALRELIESNFKNSFVPQMELLNRAFQKRAIQYDHENFSGYQASLAKVDNFLPNGESVLDFVLEKGKEKSLTNNQQLKTEGMIYIIETLNPPGALWLKQMAKNGNITPATRVKGYTDALVNGKTIDVVKLLMYYHGQTGKFQRTEGEINRIRSISFSEKNDDRIPRESEVFSDLAPTREMRLKKYEQEFQNKLKQEDMTLTKAWRYFTKILLEDFFYIGDTLSSSITGVTGEGNILTIGERITEGLKGAGIGAVSFIIWRRIIGLFVGKILGGAWKVTEKQRRNIKESVMSIFGSKITPLNKL